MNFVLLARVGCVVVRDVATISMYNMGTASRNGLKHALTLEQRKQIIAEAAEQRYVEFLGGETKYTCAFTTVKNIIPIVNDTSLAM